MKTGEARIVAWGESGARVCAAAARISTAEGGAMDALARGDGGEKDTRLIQKVLASGHKTILEHQQFTVAFQDVSVLAEQLVIEFRLASYTVKSRRYVNFSGAGYVVPDGLSPDMETAYRRNMDARFSAYASLLEAGVPREDARFVLPYCFKSNFIMTLNARELSLMICAMTRGRLSRYPEMKALGEGLEKQARDRFPALGEMVCAAHAESAPPEVVSPARPCAPEVELIGACPNGQRLLDACMRFTNRFSGKNTYKDLARDARPRELECLQYTFIIKDISLACVTHFTRHRMLSLLIPSVESALAGGGYVLPHTVRGNEKAERIYTSAFEDNARAAADAKARGLSWENLAYFALAGNALTIVATMNARELLHFFKLRTCQRAQWEIRGTAGEMLALLMEEFGDLFRYYGPSCAVNGFCPEGRLSCGRIQKREE